MKGWKMAMLITIGVLQMPAVFITLAFDAGGAQRAWEVAQLMGVALLVSVGVLALVWWLTDGGDL